MQELADEERLKVQALMNQTVKPSTQRAYERTAELYRAEHGGVRFRNMIQAIIKHADLPREEARAPSTFKSHKSALLHVCLVAGAPWTLEESSAVDIALDGYTVKHGPRRRRGALDEEKLQQVIDAARATKRPDIAEALLVLSRCILRPHDIKELTVERVDLVARQVNAKRKANIVSIVRRGEYEMHPIVDEDAYKILEARVECHRQYEAQGHIECADEQLIFPKWDPEVVRSLLERVSKEQGWPESLKFDGPHCARHGGAMNVLDGALEEVRLRGAWGSTTSARHYSQSGRVQPGESGAARTDPQQGAATRCAPKAPKAAAPRRVTKASPARPTAAKAKKAARGGKAGKGAKPKGAARPKAEKAARKANKQAKAGKRSKAGKRTKAGKTQKSKPVAPRTAATRGRRGATKEAAVKRAADRKAAARSEARHQAQRLMSASDGRGAGKWTRKSGRRS